LGFLFVFKFSESLQRFALRPLKVDSEWF
jgi:hypothetical protein